MKKWMLLLSVLLAIPTLSQAKTVTIEWTYETAITEAASGRESNIERSWQVRDETIEQAWQIYSKIAR